MNYNSSNLKELEELLLLLIRQKNPQATQWWVVKDLKDKNNSIIRRNTQFCKICNTEIPFKDFPSTNNYLLPYRIYSRNEHGFFHLKESGLLGFL